MGRALEKIKEYQQMKKAQTPTLCDNDKRIMDELLYWAKECTRDMGVHFVVDHIYPVRCGGVHHWCNLAIITASENVLRAKRFDPSEGVSYNDYILATSAYA